MSKRKGVSLDEKRMRMLQIFYDKKEFFTLKELEKIAPKEKNIVVQAVKDVLQGLVDDGLVRSEKIGTSIYFWRFPGENITATERRIAETNKKLVETEFKVEKLRKEIQKEKELKNDTEEKRKLLEEVEQLRKEEQEIKKQIAKFSDVDPEINMQNYNKQPHPLLDLTKFNITCIVAPIYSPPVLKIYSVCDVNYRFSVLTVDIRTQPISEIQRCDQYMDRQCFCYTELVQE
ncbi:meiotic nuclear division protein 1 homolog isoform X1 [Temnothorax longispinosus]|uniref:meiotic nuclear division protein 1 homolog isoform X1 n=1 Tax=Temnothorax longispinosus TaxID=300112 RepID=UPI003A9A4595